MMTTAEITLDFVREGRLGMDEAIFCEGKSPRQIETILEQALDAKRSLLLTRLSPDQRQALPSRQRDLIDYEGSSRTGFFARQRFDAQDHGLGVVSAGTSDVPVAMEATRTLAYYGVASETVHDVGVAGLWRLLQEVEAIRAWRVVIVVAGMDGALPSVIGGLAPGLVIAVPTSIGYGASKGGETALHSALASCAPGLVVCNIDNGYGAACAALRAVGVTRDRARQGE